MSNYNCIYLAQEELDTLLTNKDISSLTEIVNDGINYTLQLESLQSLLISKDINSQVSLNSFNIAIETIASNLGVQRSRIIPIITLESINSKSNMALEDLDTFLQELWIKIKTTVLDLFEKLEQYWDNNFSSLSRVRKTLDDIKAEVSEKYKNSNTVEISTSLTNSLKLFNHTVLVNDKFLDNLTYSHENSILTIKDLTKHINYFNQHVKDVTDSDLDNGVSDLLSSVTKQLTDRTFKLGTIDKPSITGEYIEVEYLLEESKSTQVIVTKETLSTIDDVKIFLIPVSKLKAILNRVIYIIDATIELKKEQDKLKKNFSELTKVFDIKLKSVDNSHISQFKLVINSVCRINGNMPTLYSFVVSNNVKLARAIVNYSKFCILESAHI